MTREKDYFKTFCKVSAAFGTASSLKALLDLVVESAIETMDGKASCLFLADEDQDIFVPRAQKGLSENYLHANPMKAKKIVAALKKKGHLAFFDATTDPRLENHQAKIDEGIASLVTVPVVVRNQTIGVLSLYTDTQRDFSPEEIEFLRALAEHGGIAIEKDRLLERIQKNALLFLDMVTNINSTLDISTVLNNLTEKVCDTLGMKGAVIRLLDEESNTLKLVAGHGLSESFLSHGYNTSTEAANRALNGETLTLNDLAVDENKRLEKVMKKEGLASMIITPITARDEVIGTFRLYSGVPREFPDDIIYLVKALAHQGGLAIQNASMYLQLKEDKKSLEEDIWSHRSWF